MPLDVADLAFDDDNEAEFTAHRVTVAEVLQVLDGSPRFYRNASGRRASHVMVGPTAGGRILVVPIEEWGGDGIWRPVTAFRASASQIARYRST
jgi:hypothetical protein